MANRHIAAGLAALLALAGPALAQDARGLALDLNTLQPIEDACRVTFVATNALETGLDALGIEVVLFDTDGLVARMVALDFGTMDEGRTKVLQFNLPALDCGAVGRVLINDVVACEAPGLSPDDCLSALALESRSGVAFGL